MIYCFAWFRLCCGNNNLITVIIFALLPTVSCHHAHCVLNWIHISVCDAEEWGILGFFSSISLVHMLYPLPDVFCIFSTPKDCSGSQEQVPKLSWYLSSSCCIKSHGLLHSDAVRNSCPDLSRAMWYEENRFFLLYSIVMNGNSKCCTNIWTWLQRHFSAASPSLKGGQGPYCSLQVMLSLKSLWNIESWKSVLCFRLMCVEMIVSDLRLIKKALTS